MDRALFVVTSLSLLAAIVSAWCALVSRQASKVALSRASTTSLRAELDEIRDAFEKNSALLKRINARTLLREYRASEHETSGGPSGPAGGEDVSAWKRRMRAQLIRPGQPVKHV
jgi:hypothetical protein